jgi:hypothetical protein
MAGFAELMQVGQLLWGPGDLSSTGENVGKPATVGRPTSPRANPQQALTRQRKGRTLGGELATFLR